MPSMILFLQAAGRMAKLNCVRHHVIADNWSPRRCARDERAESADVDHREKLRAPERQQSDTLSDVYNKLLLPVL